MNQGNSQESQDQNAPAGPAARYPVPRWVIYRGRTRRVYGVERATHQRHRHYQLIYWRRSAVPNGAATGAYGPRGQRDKLAVWVRADHCKPVKFQ